LLFLPALAALASAQPAPAPVLDGLASDPVKLGWMVGSPPAADKLIRFSDGTFRTFPQTRWSFSHTREFLPTKVVPRGSGPTALLPRAERTDLDAVTFQPMGSDQPMTWAQSLLANYTDGILVLHRGRIVYERYFGVLTPERAHIAFSVTKSFVGTLAATLVSEGVLDDHALVTRYVPELSDSGFAGATVRQVMDMTVGLKYSEVYADEKAEHWDFTRAGHMLPVPAGYRGPDSFYGYIATIKQERPHGEAFGYKTPNAVLLGWIMHRATGKALAELLQERIWSKLGVEQDAYFSVDPSGTDNGGGGFNLTLRDLARFGEMMRLDGRFNGQQIVPKAVVDDIRRGASRDDFAKAGYKLYQGWSYRDMWWVTHNEHGAFYAIGIHGQGIYIDPVAEMVIVRFASHPLAVGWNAISLPAFHAIALRLMAAPR
jgi:CubicO group peptidase (beta-lactamase class C family)